MQIDYPEHLRKHASAIPPRPEGRHMIVAFNRAGLKPTIPTPLYQVVRNDDLDGLVCLAPLSPADERPPFWASAASLVEVPGAWLDDDGYVRMPTNGVDL